MNGSSFSCNACRISLTPMKNKMNANPCDRYTRRLSMSPSRKYS
ncbi:Uncharacterised protein [Mycobacteroides abscessus subsp. abscessus]|nr:Uncharacterised protein [Mycobacteroides abscessus subsp. abscessus]